MSSNQKIRVLHFIPGFLYGGIESLFMMWNEKVDHSKFEFELLLRTKEHEISLLDEYSEKGGIYHRLTPFSLKQLFKYIKSVRSFFKEHRGYYDIMHAHGGDPFVFYNAKRYGVKKIIYHSHTTSDGQSKYQLTKKLLSKFYDQFLTQRVACSDLAAMWRFRDRDDVVIIPNSVDIDKFKFDESIRNRYRKDLNLEDQKVIISVGRLTYQKNHPLLLDIFEKLSQRRDDVVLLIVGDGPDKELIETLIEEKNLKEKVIMLGRRSDVPNLLQAADLFLMPSHYEGLPVTIVEAQASGLPALLSSVITKQVQITDLVEYLSFDDTTEVWSEKISTMIDNNTNRVDYYNTVLKTDFNIENSINKLEHIYNI